ncbi:MAG: DUF4249 domain-containing protein [Reichenbachiella sp.]
MKGFIYFFIAFSLTSCVDPYEFTIEENLEVLIIDAVLTDEQKAHKVILSKSRGLTNDQQLDTISYVSGANVWIEDDNQLVTYYHEGLNGTYETENSFAGITGQTYVLHVETPDGKHFESSREILQPGIPMDSIYAVYDERLSTEETALLKGIQFFVDTKNISQPNMNFRYEYSESYKIVSPLISEYVMDYTNEEIVPREVPINICYKTIHSNQIQTATTSGLSSPEIAELPIRYATSDEPQMRNEYMLVVKQHSISSNAYQFYKNLRENNESAGSFFDKQKGTVLGNITEVGNNEATVMGYFEVGGVSSIKRHFENADFARLGLRTNVDYGLCESPLEVGLDTLFSTISPNLFNILTFIDNPIFGEPPLSVYVNPTSCSDCRGTGSLNKPQHWD